MKYVHNDTCYPALLVIGQVISAIKSGNYDPDRTALIDHADRWRLPCLQLHSSAAQGAAQSGVMTKVPVISLNVSGLEKN